MVILSGLVSTLAAAFRNQVKFNKPAGHPALLMASWHQDCSTSSYLSAIEQQYRVLEKKESIGSVTTSSYYKLLSSDMQRSKFN